MAAKKRVVKVGDALTMKQEAVVPVEEVEVCEVTTPIEKEAIVTQAQTVAETQNNSPVSSAKEPSLLAKAGNFLSDHKWKIAAGVGVAAAAAAFVYREEIGSFIGGKVSGESAGGDAFM